MTWIQPRLAAALLLAIGLGAASAAQAGSNVYFSVYGEPAVRYDQPLYVQPEPVYVQPQPAYVQAQPEYYYQPAPFYVQPAPVYRDWYAQRGWERAQWRRHHWDHRGNWDHDDRDDRRHGHHRD